MYLVPVLGSERGTGGDIATGEVRLKKYVLDLFLGIRHYVL